MLTHTHKSCASLSVFRYVYSYLDTYAHAYVCLCIRKRIYVLGCM